MKNVKLGTNAAKITATANEAEVLRKFVQNETMQNSILGFIDDIGRFVLELHETYHAKSIAHTSTIDLDKSYLQALSIRFCFFGWCVNCR